MSNETANPFTGPARTVTRRRMLKGLLLGAGTAVAGAAAYARFVEPHWVEVNHVDLPMPGLGDDLIGYRIAHIADLHVGRRVSTRYLADCMDRVNALKPDTVVITGDLITGGLGDEIATLGKVLSKLRPRDGLIATLGNHDYSGWHPGRIRLDIADRVANVLTQVGGRTLRNKNTVISRGTAKVNLMGLDDLFVSRCKPELAFSDARRDLPIIVLSHNPDSMGILRYWPVHVILSGHTHGGQVCLPIIGPPRLPVDNRQYASGLIRVDDKVLYVTRGLGHITKVRFNCRPEITLHNLVRA